MKGQGVGTERQVRNDRRIELRKNSAGRRIDLDDVVGPAPGVTEPEVAGPGIERGAADSEKPNPLMSIDPVSTNDNAEEEKK